MTESDSKKTRNIWVLRPLPGSVIQTGSVIEGAARAFEANVLYTLVDDAQNVISPEKPITALAGAPEYALFFSNIQLEREPETTSGELRVYTRSARDGSIQDLVRVKVIFD